jgi:hypothetical protein
MSSRERKEQISQSIIKITKISYYDEQITIPIKLCRLTGIFIQFYGTSQRIAQRDQLP